MTGWPSRASACSRRAVTPEEVRAIEPALAGRYHGGLLTESDSTGDIHAFTVGLNAAAERLGVRTLFGQSVRRVTSDGRQARVTVSDEAGEQTHALDGLLVCAGVGSRALAALGDRVNVYPVKDHPITVNLLDAASQQATPGARGCRRCGLMGRR